MPQRSRGSSSREIEEGYVFNAVKKPLPRTIAHSSPRRRIDSDDEGHLLPMHLCPDKKEVARSRLLKRWVHLIPVIVILCFLILWWLSHPVKLVRKDGRMRIVSIEQIEIPHVIKNRVDHTMTRWAISPTASKSWDFLKDTENEAPTVNSAEGHKIVSEGYIEIPHKT